MTPKEKRWRLVEQKRYNHTKLPRWKKLQLIQEKYQNDTHQDDNPKNDG